MKHPTEQQPMLKLVTHTAGAVWPTEVFDGTYHESSGGVVEDIKDTKD